MNIYSVLLGYAGLILGLITLLSMFFRLGREGSNKRVWLIMHRFSGYLFIALMTVVFLGMIYKVTGSGGSFGTLATAHITIGLGLFALMIIKWLLVRPFRGQMKFAPAIGIFLIILAFITVNLGSTVPILGRFGLVDIDKRDIADDEILFGVKCARCHSLERVYLRDRNDEENRYMVKRMQAMDPEWISDEEAERVIEYLNSGHE